MQSVVSTERSPATCRSLGGAERPWSLTRQVVSGEDATRPVGPPPRPLRLSLRLLLLCILQLQ